MAVDGNGHPWVSFRDQVTNRLGVMRWTGTVWEDVASTSASTSRGYYSSMLRRRGDGSMTIAFQDYILPKRLLRVINWTGTAWQQLGQTIAVEPGHTSLAESPSGVLYLAWIQLVDGQPRVTRVERLDNDQWVTLSEVGLPTTDTFSSRILFDSAGRLWLATLDAAIDKRVRLMRYVD